MPTPRAVGNTNDRRAAVKKRSNLLIDAGIVEGHPTPGRPEPHRGEGFGSDA